MSWQQKSVMEEKQEFIELWKSREYVFLSLCEIFGISTRTGYNLVNRYKEEGELAFYAKSKRPKNIPNKTSIAVEDKIIELRGLHEDWGARKLRKLLEKDFKSIEIPSVTTVNTILKRNGLITRQRRRFGRRKKEYPEFKAEECNEIWSADFKGEFRLGNSRKCYPLTICDSKSKNIIGIRCCYHPSYHSVKQGYIKAFREHGLPNYMHTDNGTPFASINAVGRYSSLCYWLIEHEIQPIFSDPGCPQQNGSHERMHRDLNSYCKKRIKNTLTKQQEVMDSFRKEYNEVRPHETLNLETPSSIYKKSKRAFRQKIRPYDYPYNYVKLKVTKNGSIRWGAYHWVFISNALTRKYVGLEELGNGIWNVYYRHVLLGMFDSKIPLKKEGYYKLIKAKV